MRFEVAIEHVRSEGGRLPLTQIGRQAAPSWTHLESLQPHQSLDPMQTILTHDSVAVPQAPFE